MLRQAALFGGNREPFEDKGTDGSEADQLETVLAGHPESRCHLAKAGAPDFALPETPRAGMIIMALAMLIAPGMDVFAKLLTETASPGQVTLGRFLVQPLLLLPWFQSCMR